MQDLLLGIWEDLRAKRLLPVAGLLLVGILAIPIVLTKPAETPVAPAPAANVTAPADQPAIQLDTADAESSGKGSALDVFAAKDPFAPPKHLTSPARSASSGAGSGAAGASPDDTQAGSGDGAPTGGVDLLPGPSPSPSPSPTPAPPSSPREPKTTEYEYVADVTFWNGDRRRRIEGLRKLDMLPNQASPLLIFMGTTGAGGNAVFLIDSTLQTIGEGSCAPSRDNCAFVHIGPGAEQTFTSVEGDSFRLRIDEIRRVEASASAAADTPRAKTSVGSTSDDAGDPFDLPSLVDIVVESDARPVADGRSSIQPTGR